MAVYTQSNVIRTTVVRRVEGRDYRRNDTMPAGVEDVSYMGYGIAAPLDGR